MAGVKFIRSIVVISSITLWSLWLISCGVSPELEPEYGLQQSSLQAYCKAEVLGKGIKDVESDYLPRVVRCENGGAPLEALKAQAVAARSYLYYKLNTSGSIADGTSDQVYTCSAQPGAIHHQAVQETAGQVLRYKNTQVAAFYVAGAMPSTASCKPVAGDNDWSNTEKYVTYNWGKSGSSLTQTSLGWVDSGNDANRGCKSQNGAACLANNGWSYQDILKFYYGMDIIMDNAQGDCISNSNCACTAGKEESQSCGGCTVRTRICGASCQWNDWSECSENGACSPGVMESRACGHCGTQARACDNACQWGEWDGCTNEGPCALGQQQHQDCGNCGSRTRLCGGNCSWTGWSNCNNQGSCLPGDVSLSSCASCSYELRTCNATCQWGPAGNCNVVHSNGGITPCNTGLPGVCNTGHLKCTNGQATCEPIKSSIPEICDTLDNNCDGEVDNNTTGISTPPPMWAAELIQADAPTRVEPNSVTQVTIRFQNMGSKPWKAGKIELISRGPMAGATSYLWDSSWKEDQVVTTLNQDTNPTQTATFVFYIHAPLDPSQALAAICPECNYTGALFVEEQFVLRHIMHGELRCPTPVANVYVTVANEDYNGPINPRSNDGANPNPGTGGSTDGGEFEGPPQTIITNSGCSTGSRSKSNLHLFLLPALLFFVLRRRRRNIFLTGVLCAFLLSTGACKQTEVIQPTAPTPEKVPDWQKMYDEWEHPSPIPPFRLVDQEAQQFSLSRYESDFVMVGFVFSRCPMPKACPLTMKKTRQTQDLWAKLVKEGRTQGKTLKFLSFTFDPDFDTPEVLKQYGLSHGADFSRWTLATGPAELMNSALPSLFSVMALPVGPGNIRHTVKIGLLKPGLTLQNEWGDNKVDPQEIIDLVLAK
ncbi:MAG TPA: hypothetical protein EYN06_04510 [Myxococcales bacterium]|nr:hypothetical protein [Myxococcales bacterium]